MEFTNRVTKPVYVTFADLKVGDWFGYMSSGAMVFAIKVASEVGDAIDLQTGGLLLLADDKTVGRLVDVEVLYAVETS